MCACVGQGDGALPEPELFNDATGAGVELPVRSEAQCTRGTAWTDLCVYSHVCLAFVGADGSFNHRLRFFGGSQRGHVGYAAYVLSPYAFNELKTGYVAPRRPVCDCLPVQPRTPCIS